MEKKWHKNEVIVHLVDDQLQVIEGDTCGMYQIYFFVNLFNPLEKSSVVIEKSPNKHTIKKLLNEISTDRQKNEDRMISLPNKTVQSEGRMELPGNGIPVSESQSLFTRIVGFWQVPFLLTLKNGS